MILGIIFAKNKHRISNAVYDVLNVDSDSGDMWSPCVVYNRNCEPVQDFQGGQCVSGLSLGLNMFHQKCNLQYKINLICIIFIKDK